MRSKMFVVIAALLIVALVWPAGVWAKRITLGGSLTITQTGGPLTTQLVVMAVTSNRGLEKTVVQQLPLPGPLFVLPFFVNEDKNEPGDGDLDTIITLTNTTGSPLMLTLTLRDVAGGVMTIATPPALNAFETRAIRLSDLLG